MLKKALLVVSSYDPMINIQFTFFPEDSVRLPRNPQCCRKIVLFEHFNGSVQAADFLHLL